MWGWGKSCLEQAQNSEEKPLDRLAIREWGLAGLGENLGELEKWGFVVPCEPR
jgi:hypothetical protein